MVWWAFVWGMYLVARGFSKWGGCPSSFVVNQAVGCVSFGLCRRDGLGVSGSVKNWGHVGGVLLFIVIGCSHFWGWAALLSCIGA